MNGGTVYLLGDRNQDGIYKIGVTRGSVEKRVKRLQTGNSGEIYVVNSFVSKYPFFIESSLHRKYNGSKVLNEWFDLDKDEVDGFLNMCLSIENMAETLKDNPFFNYENLK